MRQGGPHGLWREALMVSTAIGAISVGSPVLGKSASNFETSSSPRLSYADLSPVEWPKNHVSHSASQLAEEALDTPIQTVSASSADRSQSATHREVPQATGSTNAETERRINVFGRVVTINVPIQTSRGRLPSIPLRIELDDTLAVPKTDLVERLQDLTDAQYVERLSSIPSDTGLLTFDAISAAGFAIRYDQVASVILIELPGEALATQDIAISPVEEVYDYDYPEPAKVSGFANLRFAAGYEAVGLGSGLIEPSYDLATAIRVGDFVLEADFSGSFAANAQKFQRSFTRLVYDMPERSYRITALDLITDTVGFLAAPDLFGVGIESRSTLFNPQRNLRADTFRSFTLREAGTVEIIVNGSEVRRLELAPGNYRLTDFPLAAGANDVDIIVTDGFGRRELASFSRFFNFSLLARGEEEFGAWLGFQRSFDDLSLNGFSFSDYNFDRPAASGFYRRGLSDVLTLGAGLQADEATQAGSIEASLGTNFGTFLSEVSVSQDRDLGLGYAGRIVYQLPPRNEASLFAGAGVAVDYTSENFTSVGRFAVLGNPVSLTASASASLRLSRKDFVSFNANYARFRDDVQDSYEVSARYSRRFGNGFVLGLTAGYEQSRLRGSGPLLRIAISRRLGKSGFGTASYNTRDDRARFTYSRAGGRGVGALNIAASADVGDNGAAVSGGLNYLANNAELGVTQSTAYNFDQTELTSVRTSAQVATAIVFADGKFGLTRPVRDSFALIRPHETLGDAKIYVDKLAQSDTYISRSSILGLASVNDLGSYVDRRFSVAVPDAPTGYDIGAGAFRLRPAYKSGYLLEVGSEYTITAIGVLTANGEAVPLASGSARLVGDPLAPVLELFTNRNGRFGIAGLKPGRWQINLNTTPPLTFDLDIPTDQGNLLRVGEVEAQ